HRCEQTARERLACAQPHALGNRQGGIVPGGVVLRGGGGIGGRTAERTRRGRCRCYVERQEPGEEAVEPGALLLRERGRLGDHGGWARRAHSLSPLFSGKRGRVRGGGFHRRWSVWRPLAPQAGRGSNGRGNRHAAASSAMPSIMARSASTSCRRVKARNLSLPCRCAR